MTVGAVIVVGSVNVDLVVHLPVLPRPGETVTGGTFQTLPGGKGGNQAVAAARLGARTALVACVGDDEHGTAARRDLETADVATTGVTTVPGAATGVAVVLVDANGENSIGVAPGANQTLDAARVDAALAPLAGHAAVVLASLEVPLDAVLAAAQGAAAQGWPLVLNPAPACELPPELLARTTVLTPNATEVERLGTSGVDGLLAAGAGTVVVTLGSDGAQVHRSGASPMHVPAWPASVVDTTGAGDAFSAALAVALARGEPLERGVPWAAAAAALATEGAGARGSLPDAAAVEDVVRAGARRPTPG